MFSKYHTNQAAPNAARFALRTQLTKDRSMNTNPLSFDNMSSMFELPTAKTPNLSERLAAQRAETAAFEGKILADFMAATQVKSTPDTGRFAAMSTSELMDELEQSDFWDGADALQDTPQWQLLRARVMRDCA
jgi:hypothetical protein